MNHIKEIQLENILITDAAEIDAVKRGLIIGDVYSDGDVYANVISLLQFRQKEFALERSAA